MKPDPLEDFLAEYSRQPVPENAKPSRTAIWAEINRRRNESFWARIVSVLDLRELLGEPRVAIASLALAALVGSVPAAIVSRHESERQMARHSIHFEVFDSAFAKPIAMATSDHR